MKNALESLCLFVALLPLPIAAEAPFEDLVRETQFLLMEAGINPGPIDGKLGGKTKEDIGRYEALRNLPRAGQPTHDLISKLREELHHAQSSQDSEAKDNKALNDEI